MTSPFTTNENRTILDFLSCQQQQQQYFLLKSLSINTRDGLVSHGVSNEILKPRHLLV